MAAAPLYGLILAGGRSTRMGMDKGLLVYHDIPQRDYLAQIAKPFCQLTFLSLRSDQAAGANFEFPVIVDDDLYRGPFNGLLTAHARFPNAAWLVLACDLPLMDRAGIGALVTARDPGKMATAYATKKTGLPEPLAAIWEPAGLEQAKTFLEDGTTTCPRKYLLNAKIRLFMASDDRLLTNANHPDERDTIRAAVNPGS